MEHRVVITGLGAITPVGNNVNEFWNNIKDGVCGITTIDKENYFDTTEYDVHIAGTVKDFSAEDYLGKKEARRSDKFVHLAIKAADEAMEDAKLKIEDIDPYRFGVIVGSGIGGYTTMESQMEVLFKKGPKRVSPFYIPSSIINMVSGTLSMRYGAKGISASTVSACASGASSIGDAFRQIKHGYMDIVIAGGSEAAIIESGIAGFSNLKALSTSQDLERASIPFDKERNGFVMGEGAGILILESLESAKKRGAKIYGEVIGYGATSDAYHITSPNPNGEGAAKAMESAILEGGINKNDVAYINAHGTSTAANDKVETQAIKNCFGERAYDISISSTKSMTGHLLGAAGAIEAIICVKAMNDSFVPPTIGYRVKDEACDLNYTPNEGVNKKIDYSLSNSLGFGGHNVSLLFKNYN